MSVKLGSIWIDNDSDLLVIVKSLEGKLDGKVKVVFNYIVRTGDKSVESASELKLFLQTKTKLVRDIDSDYSKGYEHGVQHMKMQDSIDKYLEMSEKLSLTEDEVDNIINEAFEEGHAQAYSEIQTKTERERALQEKAYDEGYDQCICDLIEEGVLEGTDEEYSEYKFGAVEDDEEEYCLSKELDKVKEGGCVFILDGKVVGDRIKDSNSLDEYNRGYEVGKSRGITLGYNKRDYEESRVGGIDGSERKHSHYFKDVRHLDYVDIYQVCKLFPVDDDSGAIVHARKKLLVAGGRGAGKDMIKDITEARDTLNRYLQIEGHE